MFITLKLKQPIIIMETKKVNVEEFNENDWEFERSSGYAGYRNINMNSPEYDQWIHQSEFSEKRLNLRDYNYDLKLLHDFRRDTLPFDEYLDYVLKEFLHKKYNETK